MHYDKKISAGKEGGEIYHRIDQKMIKNTGVGKIVQHYNSEYYERTIASKFSIIPCSLWREGIFQDMGAIKRRNG